MGVSIFQQMNKPVNGLAQQVGAIRRLIGSQDPSAVVQMMCQRNPQFAKFANECKGMSTEDICKKYGIDFNALKEALR